MPTGITALELITNSMRKLGVIATGETPSAAEAADGLAALGDIIETWNIQGMTVWNTVVQAFTLTPNDPSYSIGPTGDLVTAAPRPVEITGVYASYLGVDYRVAPWTYDQYMSATIKATSALWPTRYAYVNDYPNGMLFLWPVPSVAITLNVNYTVQIPALTGLSDVMQFPPGYIRALQWELAGELASEYGIALNQTQMLGMKNSRAAVEKSNRTPAVSSIGGPFVGGRIPTWQGG